MAFSLFLNGIFNLTYFGIPYYAWIIVFMLIVEAIVGALFYFFFWLRLKPYHGVFWSHVKKMGGSFVFDENMHFDLITERSSKVIFNETFAEAQDAEGDHTEAPAATVGKVRMDFIFDPDKWTYPNSNQHKIIEDIAEDWNARNENDQIRTLVKFSRYLAQGKLDSGYSEQLSRLKRTVFVPWSRIRMMYREREESDIEGFTLSLSKLLFELENKSYNQYGFMFLVLFGIIDIAIIAAHFIK